MARENAKGAWVLAHELARALNVTPWEALLGEVRRTAGSVAWLDRKVAECDDDALLLSTRIEDDPESGQRAGYKRWVDMRMQERQHLARVSKMAIDAGVAQQLVAQFTLQGETYAKLVTELITELGLAGDEEERAFRLMRSKLLALEAVASGDKVLEGEVMER